MRSLEECKAEIFRRSEVKIRQRKQMRNRIVAACLPLCLCLGAVAAWGIGQQKSAADTAENMAMAPESVFMDTSIETEYSLHTGTKENAGGFVSKVTINGTEQTWEEGDQIPPAQQYAWVQSLYENKGSLPVKQEPSEAETYRIVFTMSDGTQSAYVLTGNVLTQEQTGKKVSLNHTQVNELKLILGIEQEELQ